MKAGNKKALFLILVLISSGVLIPMCKHQKTKLKKTEAPISSASTYWLSDSDLKKLMQDAKTKDKDVAFRIYQHYAFADYDTKKSTYWLKEAAKNGHAIAQYSIAHDLIYGEQTNINEAEIWAKESIKNGNQSALKLIEKIETIKKQAASDR